jgi:hypothetical protein
MATNADNAAPGSKSTTLAALKGATAQGLPMQIEPNAQMGFATMQSFELMQRAAKLLASSTLVPKEYQSSIPNCVIALNMAQRIGADPLLVMQNLYVVHGRPGWSSQFLIATFNHCGRFSAIRYKWGGTEGKDDWSCQAYAKERESGEDITGPVITIALAKKEGWYTKTGSKWQSIPQLMLMYRAAAWLVRTHAPEIAMGLQTAEEIGDVYEATRGRNGGYTVDVEQLRDQVQPAGAIEQKPSNVDHETWVGTIKGQTDPAQLEKSWADYLDQCATAGIDTHPDAEDAYKAVSKVLAKS